MKNQTIKRNSLTALTAVAFSIVSGSSAWAATGTWTGATDSSWQDANWNTAVPGAISGTVNTDTALFNSATPTGGDGLAGSPVLIDSGRNLGSITFDTNAGAYVIGTTGGNALNLTGGGTIQNAATLTSGNIETINAPLVLDGNYTIANNSTYLSSGLQIGGSITNSANTSVTLTLTGSNTSTNNVISGAISTGTGTGVLSLAMAGTGFGTLRATIRATRERPPSMPAR